jgi:hypothetical protein
MKEFFSRLDDRRLIVVIFKFMDPITALGDQNLKFFGSMCIDRLIESIVEVPDFEIF